MTESTLIGPLTTAFIPPPECNYVSFEKSSTDTGLAHANLYDLDLDLPSATRCFPYGALATRGYYSPGVCPRGWQSQVTVNGLEKTHNCCPTFATRIDPVKSTEASTKALVRCVGLVSQIASSTIAYYTSGSFVRYAAVSEILATLEPKAYVVIGGGVQVRFKDSDFTPIDSTSLPTLTGATSSSFSSSVTQTSNTLDGSSNTGSAPLLGGSSELLTSVKIGIGIGVSAAFLLIAAMAIFFLRNRRKRLIKSKNDPAPDLGFQTHEKAELPVVTGSNFLFSGGGAAMEKPELDDTARIVLPGGIARDDKLELDSTTRMASLGGKDRDGLQDKPIVVEIGDNFSSNRAVAELGQEASYHPPPTVELSATPSLPYATPRQPPNPPTPLPPPKCQVI